MAVARIYLIVFLFSFLYSISFEEKIISYIGEKNYYINKNFINSIFKNNTDANSLQMLNILKSNGFLNLKLERPQNIFITLKTNSSPIFLGYCINSSLNSMGYSYFYISSASRDRSASGDDLVFTYTFNSESNIDPTILAAELISRGYEVRDIEKSDITSWIFTLDLVSPNLINTPMLTNSISLNKVSGTYWLINTKEGIMDVSVINKKKWRPKIILFDRDFVPVNTVESDEEIVGYSIQIIKDIRFILITDNYNAINLRDGINISFTQNKLN